MVPVVLVSAMVVGVSFDLFRCDSVVVLFDIIDGMIDMVPIARVRVISVIVLVDFDLYSSHIVPLDLVSEVLGIVLFDTILVLVRVSIAGMLLFSSLLSFAVGETVTSVVVRF